MIQREGTESLSKALIGLYFKLLFVEISLISSLFCILYEENIKEGEMRLCGSIERKVDCRKVGVSK